MGVNNYLYRLFNDTEFKITFIFFQIKKIYSAMFIRIQKKKYKSYTIFSIS